MDTLKEYGNRAAISLKWQPRKKRYIGCNRKLIFDPATMVATSYGWWEFFKVIDDKNVFNSYKYSPTTSNHQREMERFLGKLGITIDRYVDIYDGLNCDNYKNKALVSFYEQYIDNLFHLRKKGIHKKTKIKLINDNKELKKTITMLKNDGCVYSMLDLKSYIKYKKEYSELRKLKRAIPLFYKTLIKVRTKVKIKTNIKKVKKLQKEIKTLKKGKDLYWINRIIKIGIKNYRNGIKDIENHVVWQAMEL